MKIRTSLLTITAVAGFMLPLTAQTVNLPSADLVETKSVTQTTVPTISDLKATYEGLKLTNSQKAKLKGIVFKYKDAVNYQVNQVVQQRRALRTIINTVPTNEANVRAQSSVVAGAETELAVTRAKISGEVQAILTTEQINQLKSAQAKIYRLIDNVLIRIRAFFSSIVKS